uniref:Uncharacterized protein n=1 Tax=Anguilla anguilla TaxID=7936 RepID=A0A0E9SNB3_ANGAN
MSVFSCRNTHISVTSSILISDGRRGKATIPRSSSMHEILELVQVQDSGHAALNRQSASKSQHNAHRAIPLPPPQGDHRGSLDAQSRTA